LGVLLDYVENRLEEVRSEAAKFKKGPLDYLQTNQPVRKALLLEWLDYARPLVGTRWEHKVEAMKGKK